MKCFVCGKFMKRFRLVSSVEEMVGKAWWCKWCGAHPGYQGGIGVNR